MKRPGVPAEEARTARPCHRSGPAAPEKKGKSEKKKIENSGVLRARFPWHTAACYLVLLEFLEFLTSAIAAAAMRAAPTMMKRRVPMPPVDGSGSGSFGVNSQDELQRNGQRLYLLFFKT